MLRHDADMIRYAMERCIYLRKHVITIRERLADEYDRATRITPAYSEHVSSGTVSSPQERALDVRLKLISELNYTESQARFFQSIVEDWLNELQDERMANIVRLRVFQAKTWKEVGKELQTDPQACSKYFYRRLNK